MADAALMRRLDSTEDRARAIALRGFPARGRRRVLEVGRAWLTLNPRPGPAVRPETTFDASWAEPVADGVVSVAARAYAAGGALEREVRPPPELVASAIPIREDEQAAALEAIETLIRPGIVSAAQDLDESVVSALERITLQAVSRGWSVERYQGAVQRALAAMGASSATFGTSWMASWYRTLLTSAWAQGLDQRLRQEPTRRLWPYLEYVPRRDDRVRPNHAHLRGFAAPPGWPGWRRVGPANGYNCRCRLAPVSWQEVRRRRWEGQLPGRSEAILASWPGPDPGFAR